MNFPFLFLHIIGYLKQPEKWKAYSMDDIQETNANDNLIAFQETLSLATPGDAHIERDMDSAISDFSTISFSTKCVA